MGRRRAAASRWARATAPSTPSTRPCGACCVGAYPHLAHIHLTDYRVRILDGVADTDAVVRVLIDSTDGEQAWTTIGVSTNIIEASWQALTDALVWGLLHPGTGKVRRVAAPEHVPVDRHRHRARLRRRRRDGPQPWRADAPRRGHRVGPAPRRRASANQGPDQGYALTLARRFDGTLTLGPGEHEKDALAGAVAVALKRASLFGRAPVVHDLTIALTVWGFLGDAPSRAACSCARRARSRRSRTRTTTPSCARIVDLVPESTLRSTPDEVRDAHATDWRSLLTETP